LDDPEEAIKESKKSLAIYRELNNLEWQRFVLWWEGIFNARLGSMDEAQRISYELKEMIENGLNKKAMRYYYRLEGTIELEKKNYDRAIELFNRAISLLPYQSGIFDDHIFFMEPLAQAYYRSGDLIKAREEYEKITSLTVGRSIAGNLYATSFYILGKISEEQGNTAKAIENYEKFLDLWNDADPGIVEVEDAKRRLADLKN
jgi:tetratricopeptide (TPR) repeat protein